MSHLICRSQQRGNNLQNRKIYNMIDLLQKTAAPDITKQARQYAQKAIKDLITANPKPSLLQCAQIFISPTIPINIRLNASALVLYCLRQKVQNMLVWDTLQHEQKIMFNEQILTSMIDQDKNIRRNAANVIATICCIQLPRGGWQDIIKNITFNTKNQNFIVKEVSFLTLGFICEGISESNCQLNVNVQEQILAAILNGILDNPSSVIEKAFKALRDGMKSFSELFHEQNNRQFLLKLICQAFSLQYANLSLQCLIEYTKFNLNYITSDILSSLAQNVQPFLQNHSQTQTCILSMQFWSTLIKNDEIQSNFPGLKCCDSTNKALEALIQAIYSSNQQEMTNAAENAIYSIISQDFQAYELYLYKFINQACTSTDLKVKKAGIIVQSIFFLSSPQRKKKQYGDNLLNITSMLIMDNNYSIKRLAVHQLSKVAQEDAEYLLSHPKLIDFLEFSIIQCSKDNSMMRNYSHILYFLAGVLKKPQMNITFRKIFDFILNLISSSEKSLSFIKDCLFSLSNIISINTEINIAIDSIYYVRSNIAQIQNLSPQKQQVYYQGLLTMAYTSLNAFRANKLQISQEIGVSLYQIVVGQFQKDQNVNSDGFYLMAAILHCMPQKDIFHQDFWKYIQFGLYKYEQSDIFKGVLSCICEFFQFYNREGLAQKLSFVLQVLLKLFESTDVSRQLKLQILITIGDLCLRCGAFCEPFLGNIIDFIRISMQGAVEINDYNYVEILQETIVETLLCIFHSDFSIEAFQTISGFVESIIQFIAFSTEKMRRPKLSYLKDCISLLVDVILQFPEIKQIISRIFVEQKICLLIKFGLGNEQMHQMSFLKKQFNL